MKSMELPSVLVQLSHNETIANVTLNRPQKHNALNQEMIRLLSETFHKLKKQDKIRAVFLYANGASFSAGADLLEMKQSLQKTARENTTHAKALADLMWSVHNFPAPLIAFVQGNVYGGGLGLLANSDVVFSTKDSMFCFSETKLGLIPAIISPFIVKAIGERQAKRYLMTAESFNANQAQRLGLVHELTDNLEQAKAFMLETVLKCSPQATKSCKQLLKEISTFSMANPRDQAKLINLTAEKLAQIRISSEAQDGLSAFFDQRPANWTLDYK